MKISDNTAVSMPVRNLIAILLAVAAARKIGLSPERIKNALLSYEQLPHRMETIFQRDELEIINDSKATNFDSSVAGINAIKGSPIIISGGRLKNGDSIEWVKIINKKAKAVFLFGESSQTLKKLILEGGFNNDILTFNDLSEVINYAYSYIKNNQKQNKNATRTEQVKLETRYSSSFSLV